MSQLKQKETNWNATKCLCSADYQMKITQAQSSFIQRPPIGQDTVQYMVVSAVNLLLLSLSSFLFSDAALCLLDCC